MSVYYSTGNVCEALYSSIDLLKVTPSVQNIEGFQNHWNMVVQALPQMPDDAVVLHGYKNQVELFKPLAEDFANFERAEKVHPTVPTFRCTTL